jgi:hypothetical protein
VFEPARAWIRHTTGQAESNCPPALPDVPFSDLLYDGGTTLEDFLLHDKTVQHSSRPRALLGTVEQRSGCQQPWSDHMVVSALSLGMVESAPALEQCLLRHCATADSKHIAASSLSDEVHFAEHVWPRMLRLHADTVRCGLALSDGEAWALPLLQEVLDLAHQGLRGRGLGEEVYLEPLFGRLTRRRNPGQEVALVFKESGLPGLLNCTQTISQRPNG